MITYKNKNHSRRSLVRAFTLVELVIVIVIIGVIGTLGVTGFSTVQKDGRDKARESQATIITDALEKYYDDNNEYPSVALMASQNVTLIKEKLKIKDTAVLKLPLSSASTASSIVASAPSSTQIVYGAATIDNTKNTQCQTDVNGYCDVFQLQYKKESDGSLVTINSVHNSYIAIADSGSGSAPTVPSLSASAASSSSISVTWSAVAGATSYAVMYGTSSPTTTASCTSSPCTITGLSASTTYYIGVTATNQYGTSPQGTAQATTQAASDGGSPPALPAGPFFASNTGTAYFNSKTSLSLTWGSTTWSGTGQTGCPAGSSIRVNYGANTGSYGNVTGSSTGTSAGLTLQDPDVSGGNPETQYVYVNVACYPASGGKVSDGDFMQAYVCNTSYCRSNPAATASSYGSYPSYTMS